MQEIDIESVVLLSGAHAAAVREIIARNKKSVNAAMPTLNAARDAAWDAAWWDTAWDALKPSVLAFQKYAFELLDRKIAL